MDQREACIALLCMRAKELGRLPCRSDCTDAQVQQIKATLGPWPRALEAAGLKPPSPVYLRRKAHRQQRRQQAHQRRRNEGNRL